MRYLGGKHRLAKKISRYLKKIRKPGQMYIEPFVGAVNVFQYMDNPRIGSDTHLDIILLLRAARDNQLTDFPKNMTESQYKILKRSKPSALRGLVGHNCSFAGKWFGGYARNSNPYKNYYRESINAINKISIRLQGSILNCKNYLKLEPKDCLIYCDPPYAGTTNPGNTKQFNNVKFWEVMREWSKYNTVIISEYKAPDDFKCIASFNMTLNIDSNRKKTEIKVEKLFRYQG